MSKWISIKCVSVKNIMVEVADNKSEEDAIEIASLNMNDYDDFESSIIDTQHIDTFKRHADEVFSI